MSSKYFECFNDLSKVNHTGITENISKAISLNPDLLEIVNQMLANKLQVTLAEQNIQSVFEILFQQDKQQDLMNTLNIIPSVDFTKLADILGYCSCGLPKPKTTPKSFIQIRENAIPSTFG
jgi:DNA-binding transcriptional regulator GbsR (MarR family)